ncbi:hypothetical protein MOMA_07801 [Moraxella macacae 0408225]|uniref:Outer membrane protein G1b n=1 Tax=Moraxella macacae 0408225 TaxID=1230338 RepID=L2F7K8_9GAMM|nr:hypothetical protein [Moraxella macacae]ELA08448.1 hypothetical protein MOMA_07801 [Moraxella macacae 0408225]
MRTFKLAVLPVALFATSAFAADVVVDQQVVAEPVAVSTTTYNPDNGMVKNTTTQMVDGTRTFFDTATHPAAISAEVGTLGYGGNIAWGVNDTTELVAGWNGGNPKFDINIDTTNKDSYIRWEKVLKDVGAENLNDFKGQMKFEGKMNNPYLGVNLRPLANAFTIGTGVVLQNNKVKASLSPDKNYQYPYKVTVNGVTTTYKIPANVGLEYSLETKKNLAPYLTVGFRPNITKRFGLFGEVGAAYLGGYEAKAKITGDKKDITVERNGVKVTVPVEETVRKIEQDANDKLKNTSKSWYPIAKVGATLRF